MGWGQVGRRALRIKYPKPPRTVGESEGPNPALQLDDRRNL